ncbi:MAG: hypothetical protein GY749_22935 [Desulfobacteraceae bacterium]|nr:hypothetical protein [Desulfobacteraceae bacterium]
MNANNYTEPSPYEDDNGEMIGIDPRKIPQEKLVALVAPKSPIKAIRAHCIDCSGNNIAEARKCVAINCNLWPFRMGRNVYHARAK